MTNDNLFFDIIEGLVLKLCSANATIAALKNIKNVNDENYRKLLVERGELQGKIESLEKCKTITDESVKNLLKECSQLKEKLNNAENGLKEVIDWANCGNKVDCEKEKALFRIFVVAKTLIKQIRGE